MTRTSTIVCPIDYSHCSNSALLWASRLARLDGATLHVVHVLPRDETSQQELEQYPEYNRYLGLESQRAHEALDSLRVDAPSVERILLEGISVSDAIVHHATEHKADLIVVGTHGRRGVSRWVLGSIAQRILHTAPTSVVTVGKEPISHDRECYLVPVDFSEASASTLAVALEQARHRNAELLLVHVVEDRPHPAFYLFGHDSVFEIFPTLKEKSHDALKSLLREQGGIDLRAQLLVAEGRATQKITELAREHNVSLIFMADKGWGGDESRHLGSITRRVVRQAPCPVWVNKKPLLNAT